MNQRIAVSLGVFVVGFGLGYALTHMLVGGKAEGPGEAEAATASAERHNEAADGVANTKANHGVDAKRDGKAPKDEAATKGVSKVEPETAPNDEGKAGKKATANASWWESCLGKTCKVDFGGIKRGLSVRRGAIEHGKRVDWDLRFKRAPRVEILPTDRNIKVLLEAVGFDGKGKPVVAQIRWSDKGRDISGVISLHPGDKTVSMVPDPKL